MSRKEIQPTYRIPALVRSPEGQVVLTDRCANRDVIVKHPATLSLRLP